jgi:hypothetical protein
MTTLDIANSYIRAGFEVCGLPAFQEPSYQTAAFFSSFEFGLRSDANLVIRRKDVFTIGCDFGTIAYDLLSKGGGLHVSAGLRHWFSFVYVPVLQRINEGVVQSGQLSGADVSTRGTMINGRLFQRGGIVEIIAEGEVVPMPDEVSGALFAAGKLQGQR